MKKPILICLALCATFTGATAARADTITGVTITGPLSNPTITVSGTGFGTSPAPTGLAYPGYTGYNYGNELYFRDTGSKSFTAGQDGDYIGLTIGSYTDTSITLNLGSAFQQFYYPSGIYAIHTGDPYTVVVKGESYSYPPASTNVTPEPGTLWTFAAGLLGAWALGYKRQASLP